MTKTEKRQIDEMMAQRKARCLDYYVSCLMHLDYVKDEKGLCDFQKVMIDLAENSLISSMEKDGLLRFFYSAYLGKFNFVKQNIENKGKIFNFRMKYFVEFLALVK